MIGINARDLATFAIDRAASSSSSPGRRRDRDRRRRERRSTRAPRARAAELAGADAILVGSALMRAPDPGAKLAELISRPLVKVCGLTREEDVAAAAEAGADLVGLHPRAREPAPCGRACSPSPTRCSPSPSGSARQDETGADLDQLYAREDGHRARDAVLLRDGEQVAQRARPAMARGRPEHLGAAPPRPRDASSSPAGSRPTTSRDAIARGAPLGSRRELPARASSPGSRTTTRVRAYVEAARGLSTYGDYGGRYVPGDADPGARRAGGAAGTRRSRTTAFRAELDELGRTYAGRPTPLTPAERFAPDKRLYLKREDLLHTGAHKLNNALGQAVLARRLGKHRIVAETGAGQHGVATATVCARFGLECVVYMGSEDMRRQSPNVERMDLLGAEVRAVEFGTRTLKEATSEAIRDWITNVETTHYLIGSCVGPAPYPEIVRELQAVIGREAREQLLAAEGRLPEAVIACVGGGSNAIGMFAGFLDDADVRARRRRGGGRGEPGHGPGGHPARLPLLGARRRGRSDRGRALDLGRARLPRRRPGARLPARFRPRPLPAAHRRRGARRLQPPDAHRGDHPGARAGARARTRRATSTPSSSSSASRAAATRISRKSSAADDFEEARHLPDVRARDARARELRR